MSLQCKQFKGIGQYVAKPFGVVVVLRVASSPTQSIFMGTFQSSMLFILAGLFYTHLTHIVGLSPLPVSSLRMSLRLRVVLFSFFYCSPCCSSICLCFFFGVSQSLGCDQTLYQLMEMFRSPELFFHLCVR